ncbi:twin-arginine translocation signal domain-containing protein [Limnobacter sp.]|uniref:twin-arginine translocation signal domain-containing protein n=1 Tax=Limnobacter sp. TaxID=2003368 RepID=UPI003511D34F
MTKKTNNPGQPKLARRQFLVGAGAGAMAAGAALVASKQPEMVEQAAVEGAEKKSKGYQLSEHVKTYYRTLLV